MVWMFNHQTKRHKAAASRTISLPGDLWDFLEDVSVEANLKSISLSAHLMIESGQMRLREAAERKKIQAEEKDEAKTSGIAPEKSG